MTKLLASVVLCWMCIFVLTVGALKKCIFDFEAFSPDRNSSSTILDFSGLGISTLTEGGKTWRYITGEFTARANVDSSIKTSYIVRPIGRFNGIGGTRDVCSFTADVYSRYLLPFSGYRDDKPPNTTICNRDPGVVIHLAEVSKSEDLVAESLLAPETYAFRITYIKDGYRVGGMSGVFKVIRVIA